MILSVLNTYGFSRIGLALLLIHAFCVLLALICHEVAHGFVAYKLGDPTAKQEGRLTLNPAAHLDPIGFLMLLFVGFGWAKPVPVNPRRLKKPRRDMALVSFAGPAANLLLALLSGLLCSLMMHLGILPLYNPEAVSPLSVLCYAMWIFMILNVGLALFNLIPLPPLDGSNILVSFLPPNKAAKYLQIRLYMRYILLGIVLLNVLASYSTLFAYLDYYLWLPFQTLRSWIAEGILALGNLLFGWI